MPDIACLDMSTAFRFKYTNCGSIDNKTYESGIFYLNQ